LQTDQTEQGIMGRSRNDSPLMTGCSIGIPVTTLYRTRSGAARRIQRTA